MNEHSSVDFKSRIYIPMARTLFLTREARKAVRFLTRWSPHKHEALI
jgi:hypothetical protein